MGFAAWRACGHCRITYFVFAFFFWSDSVTTFGPEKVANAATKGVPRRDY